MDLDMKFIGNQQVSLWNGSHAHLNAFWAQGPLVLVFLRHYG